MPSISIIVPIFNQEDNIRLCIDSVLNQSLTDFELILINNGSTDGSGEICQEYSEFDNRIIILNRDNNHLGATRNEGISLSKGDYIVFIDCEDFIHKEMLQVLYEQIIQHEADIALCDFEPIEEGEYINEKRSEEPLSDFKVTTTKGVHALHGLYDVDRLYSVPWSKMYRKKIFNHIRYPDRFIDEDEFIAHELLYQSTKVVYVQEPLYYYVICVGRKGSETPIRMTVEKFAKMSALYKRSEYFREKRLKKLEERALLHFIDHFFWYYLTSQKELPEAIKERKQIKILYNKLFFRIIGHSQINIKRKLIYSIFRFSPNIHKLLTDFLNDKRVLEQS